MQRRDSGAAHVNIFFFLILLVLFLGALGFGYVQMTEAIQLQERLETVRAENYQLEADIRLRDHYVEDVRKVVGQSGTYAGREGFVYVDPDDPTSVEPKPMGDVALPSNIENTLVEFARQVQIPESQAMPIDSLLAQTTATLGTKDQRIADLTQQNTSLTTQVRAAQTAAADAAREKQTEVSSLTETHNELQQRITSDLAQYDNRINAVRSELRSKQEELDSALAETDRRIAQMRKEMTLVQAQNAALQSKIKLINPPQEPDGRVLTASNSLAWIDLGINDMIQRGMVFEIRSPSSPEVKAKGRVTRLERDRAQVELFEISDPLNPVVQGDQISNDLYAKNLTRTIYLMGRFSYPNTKPMVKLALERLGNKVVDRVAPGVDLIIVGGDTLNEDSDGLVPVTDSEEYKQALSLGIEIAPVAKVRDFLKLGE